LQQTDEEISMRKDEMVATVIQAVQSEMQMPDASIEDATSLPDLKGFNSLIVASLLERLELQFDCEMDPALILPETFANPRAIAEAFAQSMKEHTTILS
jgi:acyl carrier protein